MALSRPQTIGLIVAAIVLAFLIGFVPTWSHARSLEREAAVTRFELRLARLQGRMGAALTEAMRSNYERSRQIMTEVFSELQAVSPALTQPERRAAADQVLAHRDEMVTLLSRNEPESVQRLMLLYTRFAAAVDPALAAGATGTTPTVP
jgi:hypothetical protein